MANNYARNTYDYINVYCRQQNLKRSAYPYSAYQFWVQIHEKQKLALLVSYQNYVHSGGSNTKIQTCIYTDIYGKYTQKFDYNDYKHFETENLLLLELKRLHNLASIEIKENSLEEKENE